MSDLIDRAALKEVLYHEVFETDSGEIRWDSGCWIRYHLAERVINSLPSVTSPEPEYSPMTREEALDKMTTMLGAAIMEEWHPRNIEAIEFALSVLARSGGDSND